MPMIIQRHIRNVLSILTDLVNIPRKYPVYIAQRIYEIPIGLDILFIWIPSDKGISDNEIADKLAKEADSLHL